MHCATGDRNPISLSGRSKSEIFRGSKRDWQLGMGVGEYFSKFRRPFGFADTVLW